MFLGGNGGAGRQRVPITIYVDPDEPTTSADARKRVYAIKQDEGAGWEDAHAEGAKRAHHESGGIIQVRRQAVGDQGDAQWSAGWSKHAHM